MNATICTSAGKFSYCNKCPLSKPNLRFIKDAIGELAKWKFMTENRMIIDYPIVNKTSLGNFTKRDKGRDVIAWVTLEAIEILRFRTYSKFKH